MSKVWIEVFRDTIEDHNEDENLCLIMVEEQFAEKYFNECIREKYDCDIDFFNWVMNHEASETMDFYEYANKHDAILFIKRY